MKTVNYTPKTIYVKVILISILLIKFTFDTCAQDLYKSIEVAHDVTSSGLGGNIYIGIGLNQSKNTLSLGVNIQRKKVNISGIQINYRYNVEDVGNEKMELFFYGNLTIHANAFMAQGFSKIENPRRLEDVNQYSNLGLKVIESYAGAGVKLNHTSRINSFYSLGFGAFHTLNKNYDAKIYRQKAGISLQLKIGLVYNIIKATNSNGKIIKSL